MKKQLTACRAEVRALAGQLESLADHCRRGETLPGDVFALASTVDRLAAAAASRHDAVCGDLAALDARVVDMGREAELAGDALRAGFVAGTAALDERVTALEAEECKGNMVAQDECAVAAPRVNLHQHLAAIDERVTCLEAVQTAARPPGMGEAHNVATLAAAVDDLKATSLDERVAALEKAAASQDLAALVAAVDDLKAAPIDDSLASLAARAERLEEAQDALRNVAGLEAAAHETSPFRTSDCKQIMAEEATAQHRVLAALQGDVVALEAAVDGLQASFPPDEHVSSDDPPPVARLSRGDTVVLRPRAGESLLGRTRLADAVTDVVQRVGALECHLLGRAGEHGGVFDPYSEECLGEIRRLQREVAALAAHEAAVEGADSTGVADNLALLVAIRDLARTVTHALPLATATMP